MLERIAQDKAVNVVRLKEGEAAPVPDPSTTALGLGGVALSATGRPQRKTRGKSAQPFTVTCSSDETVNFFKLKASPRVHRRVCRISEPIVAFLEPALPKQLFFGPVSFSASASGSCCLAHHRGGTSWNTHVVCLVHP